MNDATPTRTKCRPAVRLSYDVSEIEDTLTAFGHLEEAARSAVDAIYRQSLESIYVSSEGYVYSASVQHGDFLVNFTVTSNLFSATRIEYNPDEDPTDIFDGEIIEILGDGDIIILPTSPLTQTVCFWSSNEDGETYTFFSIEPIGNAVFLTCAPPDRINFENNSVLENEITVFVSDYDLDEGGEVLFEISLSNPISDQVEMEYNIDFTILENRESRDTVSGTVTFEPGQTNAVVIIECERSLPDAEMHLVLDHNRPTLMGTINDCHESTTGMERQMIHKNWVELIKPTQLEIKPSSAPARQANVIAEPLERGFGLTIDNGGIMELWVREARLFKYGSDTGTDFSRSRKEREELLGGSTITGGVGFDLANGGDNAIFDCPHIVWADHDDDTLFDTTGSVQIIDDGSVSFGGVVIDMANDSDSTTDDSSYTVFDNNGGTDTATVKFSVGSVQLIDNGDAIFDTASIQLTNGGNDAMFDAAGMVLTIGGGDAIFGGAGNAWADDDIGALFDTTGLVEIIGDSGMTSSGARIDLTHGGNDATFDAVGNAWVDGGGASHGLTGTVKFAEMCEGAISPASRMRLCEWAASKRLSGTYRKELFPQQDHFMHKTYIDDSMYTSYIASRSNSLGRCGEAPQQTPH